MGTSSGPTRTCVGCRRRFAQAALQRFVRRADGWSHDRGRRRAAGRGAYLCSGPCAVLVVKNKRFSGLSPVAVTVDWDACTTLRAGEKRDMIEGISRPPQRSP